MRHNNKEDCRVVNDLTTERKGKVSIIQNKKGNCLIEEDTLMSMCMACDTVGYNVKVQYQSRPGMINQKYIQQCNQRIYWRVLQE